MHGCAFRWTQCFFKKTKELGLISQYYKDRGTRKFCRLLLSLHFLPADQISAVFNRFHEQARVRLLKFSTFGLGKIWSRARFCRLKIGRPSWRLNEPTASLKVITTDWSPNTLHNLIFIDLLIFFMNLELLRSKFSYFHRVKSSKISIPRTKTSKRSVWSLGSM